MFQLAVGSRLGYAGSVPHRDSRTLCPFTNCDAALVMHPACNAIVFGPAAGLLPHNIRLLLRLGMVSRRLCTYLLAHARLSLNWGKGLAKHACSLAVPRLLGVGVILPFFFSCCCWPRMHVFISQHLFDSYGGPTVSIGLVVQPGDDWDTGQGWGNGVAGRHKYRIYVGFYSAD